MNTTNNGNMNDNIRNKPLEQDNYNQGFKGATSRIILKECQQVT